LNQSATHPQILQEALPVPANAHASMARYEEACRAVAAAASVDEAKDFRDKSEAMRAYARQAKNKQLAFMTGIQDKSIQIKGNPALVIWFQGLTKYLKPKKKK
jgi:hydroxypyruvate isomerase